MNTVLIAKGIDTSTDEDLNLITIGFANDKFKPTEYIIFQQAIEMLDGDEELGFEKAYIEHNDQLFGSYSGIKRVSLSNNGVGIFLEEKTAKKIKTEEQIQIILPQGYNKLEEIKKQFKLIFKNEPDVFISEI